MMNEERMVLRIMKLEKALRFYANNFETYYAYDDYQKEKPTWRFKQPNDAGRTAIEALKVDD